MKETTVIKVGGDKVEVTNTKSFKDGFACKFTPVFFLSLTQGTNEYVFLMIFQKKNNTLTYSDAAAMAFYLRGAFEKDGNINNLPVPSYIYFDTIKSKLTADCLNKAIQTSFGVTQSQYDFEYSFFVHFKLQSHESTPEAEHSPTSEPWNRLKAEKHLSE